MIPHPTTAQCDYEDSIYSDDESQREIRFQFGLRRGFASLEAEK